MPNTLVSLRNEPAYINLINASARTSIEHRCALGCPVARRLALLAACLGRPDAADHEADNHGLGGQQRRLS